MTKENLNIANDLLKQIEHLESIKSKIQFHYNQTQNDALKVLLSECNDVCSALKEVKQNRFEEL